MEFCLYVQEAAACVKWAGMSAFVDSIQLILWALYLWQLYAWRAAHGNAKKARR